MKTIGVVLLGAVILSAIQDGQFGAALIIGVVLVGLVWQARRVVTGHTHAGPVSLSARHEAGHMAAAICDTPCRGARLLGWPMKAFNISRSPDRPEGA